MSRSNLKAVSIPFDDSILAIFVNSTWHSVNKMYLFEDGSPNFTILASEFRIFIMVYIFEIGPPVCSQGSILQ